MDNKSINAILLSLLQDLKGDPSSKGGSTAAIAMVDTKDGVQRSDLENISSNSVIDQIGSPIEKFQYNLGAHPEVIEALSKWAGGDITSVLQSGRIDIISDMIQEYLEDNGIKTFGEGGQFEADLDIVPVTIGNKTYKLLYLYSEEEKETGLKNVDDMDSDEGAIFDYSDNPQNHLAFWMKDTTIALRILFINKDGVVISAHNGEPLSEKLIKEESEPIYWVIELNQSEQIPQGTYTNLALHDEPDAEPEEEDDDFDEKQHPELKVNKLYIYGSNGEVQGEIESGCRIFSRKSTEVILRKAKKAAISQLDKDYKALGRYVFNEIKAQDNRPAEYV